MTSMNKVFADLPVTVFEAMSQLARDNDAINLGQGFPDDPGPEDIRRAAADAVMNGYNQYPSMMGLPELRQAIAKVKEPLPAEFPLLRKGQILFTYLHLAANKALTDALLKSGVTAIAYETIQIGNRLPLLEPMSEIAGRMSVVMGAYFLAKHNGGSGVLLGGVPGVLPGRVVVIGGGTAGVNAARMATGLGADVTILEVDLERMRFLDITMGSAHTLYSSESHLRELMPNVDLLIGAVLVPGAKAPKLITRAMLKAMKTGSVLVDIAIDQGGCAETSRPTTHLQPVYVEEGVTHYCVANMPAAYARTATQALTNITYRYVELLADLGLDEACKKQPALIGGINTRDGKLTCHAVARSCVI